MNVKNNNYIFFLLLKSIKYLNTIFYLNNFMKKFMEYKKSKVNY